MYRFTLVITTPISLGLSLRYYDSTVRVGTLASVTSVHSCTVPTTYISIYCFNGILCYKNNMSFGNVRTRSHVFRDMIRRALAQLDTSS